MDSNTPSICPHPLPDASDSAARKSPHKKPNALPLLIQELRVLVRHTDLDWHFLSVQTAEVDLNKKLGWLASRPPKASWVWPLIISGTCEDGRTFTVVTSLEHQVFRPCRDLIVGGLLQQAQQLPEPEARQRRDLAQALLGKPLPVARKSRRDLDDAERAEWLARFHGKSLKTPPRPDEKEQA